VNLDLIPAQQTDMPAAGRAPNRSAAAVSAHGASHEWRELVAQMGRETAAPLTTATELVNAFATTGKIDRAGLRAIREAMDRVRRIGIIAQQISRFASGRVKPASEKLNLTQVLRDVLAQRGRETLTRGIELHQELAQADVIVDAAMLSALLQAMLDWSFDHARARITVRLELKSWPEHACLSCRFHHVPPDEVSDDAASPSGSPLQSVAQKLDTMPWQLLRRLVPPLGLVLKRDDTAADTHLSLEFPRTVGNQLISLTGLDDNDEATAGRNSQPMAGSHVLVIASRRETRNAIRETVRSMGLMVDYVTSIDEAREFCGHGLPHAIIYEAALAGTNFQKLRAEWAAEAPTLAFIEISEEGHGHAVSDLGGVRTSRIGRNAVLTALPSALTAELAQAA
jgi:hypothetical protein